MKFIAPALVAGLLSSAMMMPASAQTTSPTTAPVSGEVKEPVKEQAPAKDHGKEAPKDAPKDGAKAPVAPTDKAAPTTPAPTKTQQ